jgi:hypothetical protein
MAQRKLVQLGRALGRIVSMEMTLKLGESGYNSDMVSNSLKVVRTEVKSMISSFANNEEPSVIEDYEDSSSWLNFVKA